MHVQPLPMQHTAASATKPAVALPCPHLQLLPGVLARPEEVLSHRRPLALKVGQFSQCNGAVRSGDGLGFAESAEALVAQRVHRAYSCDERAAAAHATGRQCGVSCTAASLPGHVASR